MELYCHRWSAKQEERPVQNVLFLHGLGGTGSLWRPISVSLERQEEATYSILAPDQRGHGQSVPIESESDWSPIAFGRDLVETTQAEDFYPTWVVGHSMGVRSACAFAHLKPDWVKGLVLVDLGFSSSSGGGMGAPLYDFLKTLPTEFESRDAARAYLLSQSPDESIGQYLLAVSKKKSEGGVEITFPFDRGALLKVMEASKGISIREWVQSLAEKKMPILVLRGGTSQVWSKADFEKEEAMFAETDSILFEEFEGAGHGLPFEKRKEFVDRLVRFMENRK